MGAAPNLNDPIAVLLSAVEAFRKAGLETAAYGGLALAVYGEPRETRDVDLAVTGVGAGESAEALRALGLDVSMAFDRVVFGGLMITRLMLLGEPGSAQLHVVDLVEPRSGRYARAAVDRAMEGSLRGETLRILTPEDFTVFKVLSTRERDLEDASTLLRALGDRLDQALVEAEVSALRAEIPDFDIGARWSRLKSILA